MIQKMLIVATLLLMVGCQTQTRVYDVNVKNESIGPVTIWLTKDGPPYEAGWMAPEDLAIESPKQSRLVIGGVVVPQGKTASTGPLKGQFDPQTHAILRVYGGQLSFNELLANSRDSANRVDLPLAPGKASYIVTGAKSMIAVNPAP